MPERADTASELHVEGSCPECGAPFRAGIWDHSFHCEYCGSLLLSKRELGGEVFVVTSGSGLDPIDILIAHECERLRGRLTGTSRFDTAIAELSAHVLRSLRELEGRLRGTLSLVESVDFFAPYEVRTKMAVQGILGRRRGLKESYLKGFVIEELARRYDAGRFNLRDRGLKIRALRLQLLSERHLAGHEPRFLDAVRPAPGDAGLDRSGFQRRVDRSVICRIHDAVRERRLLAYKHLTYAHVRRGARDEHYLIDRQFDGIAGRLRADEVERFRELPARPLADVVARPALRALASECPNCGWELELPPREHVVFCPTCALGIAVEATGLSPRAYRAVEAPELARDQSALWFPFWAFPFQVKAAGARYARIWDWLGAVGPQPLAEQFRETDPAESLLFLPARELLGTPALDDVFSQLAGWVNWRQPRLRAERPLPAERTRLLGVELPADEAWSLARFALLALHDVQSTRRLDARSFTSHIGEAEPVRGEAALCLVPLVFRGEEWLYGPRLPGSSVRGFARSLLGSSAGAHRVTKTFNLA